MKNKIKTLIPLFAVFLVFACVISVSASWNSDVGGGKKVPVGSDEPFVVSSYLGVDSLYSAENSSYSSAELVTRFYKEAYGLNISTGANGPVMNTKGYAFKTPNPPAQGDIVYSPSTGRWAIVKSASRSSLVLFEQDTVADGKAAVDRVAKYPSDSYAVYSPRALTGSAFPELKNADTGALVLTANGRYSETTSPAAQTTSKADDTTDSTTKKDKTTAPNESTYKDNSSVAYTTYKNPDTTAAPAKPLFTTAPMPSGYEEFFTSGKETDVSDESASTDYSELNPYEEYETREIITAPAPQEEKKPLDPTLIFGIAVIGGIVFITAAGILAGVAIKKRGDDDDD